MKLKSLLISLAVVLSFGLTAEAQYTHLTAAKIQSVNGTLLPSGQMCLTPVSTSTGQPTAFNVGGGNGEVLARQTCFPITNGSIGASVTVADTEQATPSVGFLVRILDAQGVQISSLSTYIRPTGDTWSLDSWTPTQSIPVLPIEISNGTSAPVGTCTAPSLYYQNGTALYTCVEGAWILVVSSEGIQGPAGATGATGPQGDPGDTGLTGATGAQGPKGDAGATGAQGSQGQTGAPGTAATITVGSTTTGAPGTDASVSNSGSDSAAVFDFQIPAGAPGAQGPKGDPGATGAQGPQGVPGSTGSTGAQGPAGATGATGATGDTGPAGNAATIAVGTVTPLSPGDTPTVTNAGSDSAAVFNFGIPAGATGATGAQGTPGDTGAQGAKGDTGTAGAAATITVGTVTPLSAGATPTVTNAGSSAAAVFDFGIPAGATGAQGTTGATGAKGATGDTGAAGPTIYPSAGVACSTGTAWCGSYSIGTWLQSANNLSDVGSASAARTNLGLGSAATQASSAFDAAGAATSAQSASLQKSNNLSDLANAVTALANLGAQVALGYTPLRPSNNLSDVVSLSTARTNLGLGSASTQASSAFDAAGAASTAQSTAEAFAANASNLASGTVPVAVLPAATSSTLGVVQPDNTTITIADGVISAVGGGGGSSPIFTHALSGATPTLLVNSSTVAAIDSNNLTLTTNVTSLTLPASTAVAGGEQLNLLVMQAASGGPYTLPTGTAGSPLMAGSGTTLVNSVPGGCPAIGTTVSSSAPSELLISVNYVSALSQYQIVGCQTTTPTQVGVVEWTIGATGLFGGSAFAINVPIASTTVLNSGHFTNLQVTTVNSGTCSTPPHFNVFDGATNIGSPVTASATLQARASGNHTSQTLSFNAGDVIGVYVSTAGSSCTATDFVVTGQVAEP